MDKTRQLPSLQEMARMLMAISVVTKRMAMQIIQVQKQSQFEEGERTHEPYERSFCVHQ